MNRKKFKKIIMTSDNDDSSCRKAGNTEIMREIMIILYEKNIMQQNEE